MQISNDNNAERMKVEENEDLLINNWYFFD